ncbi:ABC transporter permease [Jatrophihabitans endophyticus]|uniref:ABC transporter permease n=1 Tax=Jatrophihabitans endophyticus TaxID=1206085 RepID=UPI0019FCDF62|nr:ABC transporter permease [Jatrophihabitans endophyticus]MBE7188021.1 ABC transporter permease [Jatrophihabitans endophyticus]
MIRLIHAEFRKLRTTQVWFWLLVATVAVAGLLVVAQIAPSGGVRSAHDVPDMFTSSVTVDVVVFVLGVLGVTTEFRYQTITPTLLQTPSRWAVVTAKLLTYTVVGVAYAAAAVIVQLLVAVPWLAAKNIHVDYSNGRIVHALVGVFVVVALFGIVGLGIGALLKNQIVAVVVGVIFLLVLENVIVAIPGVKHAFPYTPGGAGAAILHTTGSRLVNGVSLLPTWGGVVVLLLWAFVPALVGASYTLNRDIT